MRVTDSTLYRIFQTQVASLQNTLQDRYAQMATGKKNIRISDDPVAGIKAIQVKQEIQVLSQFEKNIDSSQRHLGLEESTLLQVKTSLTRARDLALQASSPAFNDADRQAVAIEIQEISSELLGLANTRNAEGDYIFSGFNTSQAPFSENSIGQISYNGDEGQRFLEISKETKVAINDHGFGIFSDIIAPEGSVRVQYGSNNTGSALIKTSINDSSQWQSTISNPEDYTVTYSSSSPSQITVTGSKTGALSGSPFTFNLGDTINLGNGLSVTFSSLPTVNDTFTLATAKKQDLFTTLRTFADAIDDTGIANTEVIYQMDQVLKGIDNGLDNVIDKISEIGSRINVIQRQTLLIDDLNIINASALGQIEGIDYAEVVSEVTQLTFNLEAAQSGFARIQGLSLFNLL